jgi:hypothetical protein
MKFFREIFVIVLIVTAIYFAFINGVFSPFNETTLNENTSQFISLQGKDEYVLSELVTHESFKKIKIKEVFGQIVGNAEATVSATAYFKYYIKFGELVYEADEKIMHFTIKKLYLSNPVAYDSFSIRTKVEGSWLGPDPEKLKQELQRDISSNLYVKGMEMKNFAREKSARALADNMYEYFKINNIGGLDGIRVSFDSVKSKSDVIFSYVD